MAKTACIKVLCVYSGEEDREVILLKLLRVYLESRKMGAGMSAEAGMSGMGCMSAGVGRSGAGGGKAD